MTDKQKIVLKGLLELTLAERNEVFHEANNFKDKSLSDKQWLTETLEKAQKTLGPISGAACPCCGRGR